MYKSLLIAMSLAALASSPTQAATELITNGNFTTTTVIGSASSTSAPSQLNYNGYGVQGWTSSPSNAYTFLFNPNLAGSAAYTSNGQYGNIQLYTSANGGSATAPASLVSPVGGNFIAASGAFQTGPLSQVVNSLSIGSDYQLSFYWAGSQQAGFDGMSTEAWGVTFGNQSFTTATASNPEHGFTPWIKVNYTFKASSTRQTLSFLASGGPSGGQAPFSLLDGVSLQEVQSAVPEPTSWVMMLFGFSIVGFSTRRRTKALPPYGDASTC